MRPEDAKSPKSRLKGKVSILQETEHYSLAIGNWDGENRVLIRWNGKGESKGFPTSRGHGTWFVLPKEIALAYAKDIGGIMIKEVLQTTDKPIN